MELHTISFTYIYLLSLFSSSALDWDKQYTMSKRDADDASNPPHVVRKKGISQDESSWANRGQMRKRTNTHSLERALL